MATISIADNDARVQHSIGGGGNTADSTQFTIDFPFFDLDDINVIITNSSGVDTTLTRGSGAGTFAVTGTAVDDGFSGGNLTLGSAYTSSTVTIFRDIPVARTTDFATSGPFNIAALNTELDRVIAIEQELETSLTRTMKLPDSDATASLVLPNVDTRKGKTLAFNATSGAAEAGPSVGAITTVSAISADIAALADIEDGTTATDAISGLAAIKENVTTVAGISSNVTSVAGAITNINLLAPSDVRADMALLGTADVIADMALLANTDVIADMNTLATSDIVSDLNTLATSDIVSDLNTLATADIVSDINTLATSDIVSDLNTLATSDIVSDINTLATSDIVSDLNTLATSDFVSDLNAIQAIASNVTTVADNSSNINTVASNISTISAKAPAAGSSDIVTTGALNSGSITSGFGAIDNGSSNITTTGVGTFGSLDISGNIDVDGTTNLDDVDIDGTTSISGHASIGVDAVNSARALTVAGATDGSSSSILVLYNSSLSSKFSVRDDGFVSVNGSMNITAGDFGTLTLDNSNVTHGTQLLFQHNGTVNTGADIQMSDANGLRIRTLAVEDISFHTSASAGSPAEHMRLTSAGRLGVGTTSPLSALHVASAVDASPAAAGFHAGMSGNYAAIEMAGSDGGFIDFQDATDGNDHSGRIIYGHSDDKMIFSAGGAQKMSLQASGAEMFVNQIAGFNEGNGNTKISIAGNNANTIEFFTGGSERARFWNEGSFSVGTSTNNYSASNGFGVNMAGSAYTFVAHPNGAPSSAVYSVFSYNGGIIGSISQSGTTQVSYNTSSDRRLKSNIQDAASASDKIDAIQVRQFDWNADGSHQDYGLIAQELVAIEPMAVSGDENSDEMMGVDYSKLVPMLIKEIQELRGRVAALEAS